MNTHLLNLSAWLFSAPQRTKTILMIIIIVALFAALVLPTAFAFAGPMDGGPDSTPLGAVLTGLAS